MSKGALSRPASKEFSKDISKPGSKAGISQGLDGPEAAFGVGSNPLSPSNDEHEKLIKHPSKKSFGGLLSDPSF